jgi:hypothetical protein
MAAVGIPRDRRRIGLADATGAQGQLQRPEAADADLVQMREACPKVADPLGCCPFMDDAQARLRSGANRLLAAIRDSKDDQRKLDPLFSGAGAVCALGPPAAIDSEKQATEQEKLDAIVDEFDRMRRTRLEPAEIPNADSDAMGATQGAVQLANNRLHDMTPMLTSALLLAIAGLAPAIEGIAPRVTDVVGQVTPILGRGCSANAETREHRADSGTLHAAHTELTQAESHVKLVPSKNDAATRRIRALVSFLSDSAVIGRKTPCRRPSKPGPSTPTIPSKRSRKTSGESPLGSLGRPSRAR